MAQSAGSMRSTVASLQARHCDFCRISKQSPAICDENTRESFCVKILEKFNDILMH